jgi:hypothetical protein
MIGSILPDKLCRTDCERAVCPNVASGSYPAPRAYNFARRWQD